MRPAVLSSSLFTTTKHTKKPSVTADHLMQGTKI